MFVVFWSFFFFKQKPAYEMRISDWSSDVCSSDLGGKSCRGQKSKQKGGDVGMTCQHERCYRLLWDEFQPRMARPPINGPPLYQSHRAHAAVPILADDAMIVDAYAQPSARFDEARTTVVQGKSVSVWLVLGGRGI